MKKRSRAHEAGSIEAGSIEAGLSISKSNFFANRVDGSVISSQIEPVGTPRSHKGTQIESAMAPRSVQGAQIKPGRAWAAKSSQLGRPGATRAGESSQPGRGIAPQARAPLPDPQAWSSNFVMDYH